MTVPNAAVVVMAKAPIPGRVKTRLHPLLGADAAARLQAALITHTTEMAARVAPTYLAVDPPDAVAPTRRLVPGGVEVFAQTGGSLGSRMHAAVETVAARTNMPVIVIGTDAPTLGTDTIAAAGDLLRSGAEVTIGPALDGGYYLIALAAPIPDPFGIDPALWGGNRGLVETLDVLAAAGRSVRLLGSLRDLDTPADAAALMADPRLPPGIAELLSRAGAAV